MFGIYTITSILNQMTYVGQTAVDFKKRWAVHRSLLRRGIHDNVILQRCHDKHGPASFRFLSVETFGCKDEISLEGLTDLETYWISQVPSELRVNIGTPGASPMLGKQHTDENRLKMREGQRRHWEGNHKARQNMSALKKEAYSDPSFRAAQAEKATKWIWSVDGAEYLCRTEAARAAGISDPTNLTNALTRRKNPVTRRPK